MAYADYIESFEDTSVLVENLFDKYGTERAIAKCYGALDAIVLKMTRVIQCKPYEWPDNKSAA